MSKPFQLRTIPVSIAPGSEMQVYASGTFVHCLEADQQYFGLSIEGLPFADFGRQVKAGPWRDPVTGSDALFSDLRIRNYSATLPLNVTLSIGEGAFQDYRSTLSGPRSIVGNLGNINAPLTTEGGSITPVDGVVANLTVSNNVISTIVRTQIVTSAANLRGIHLQVANLFSVTTTPGAAGQLEVWDGVNDGILLATNMAQSMSYGRDFYIPPGIALAAIASMSGTAGSISCGFNVIYKLL